jgi:hypothetical protein
MPVSYKYIDFVSQYRDPLTGGADDNSGTGTKKLFFYKLPEVQTNEAGERFATANARVKRTNLTATVVDRPGRYMINGEHIDVFQTLLARYAI